MHRPMKTGRPGAIVLHTGARHSKILVVRALEARLPECRFRTTDLELAKSHSSSPEAVRSL